MTLITTNTSSNAASSSFTSSIDSTYKLYIFKFIDINPATDSQYLTFQCNATDSTSYDENITSTAFGSYNYESGGTPALGYAGNEDQDNDDQVYQKLAYEIGNGQGLDFNINEFLYRLSVNVSKHKSNKNKRQVHPK